MDNPCVLSDDRKYRYLLQHIWDNSLPSITWIGLNPSTADENQLDPTLTRIKGFSKLWGFGSFNMLNIFAYRATDPRDMKVQGENAIGESNDFFLQVIPPESDMTIAAWGTHGKFLNRHKKVLDMLNSVYALDLTKEGFPKHPLYLKQDLKPIKIK